MQINIETSQKPDKQTIVLLLDWLHNNGFASLVFDLRQQLNVDINQLESYLVDSATGFIMDKQSSVLNQTIH